MNPLLKKEIRLLLPAWVAAMLLAIVPPWILPFDFTDGNLVLILFSLGVLILGITSFGQEFTSGAISNLLAQPLDRNRIWRTKTGILAFAFLVVCFAACASRAQVNYIFNGRGLDSLEVLLAAIVTFSGGLWTTLLLRQMTGAFWFTLLIPAAIVMLVTAALQVSVLSDSSINRIIVIFLAAYSIAGFFFARHLFLRAQDIQWTGGQIVFFSREKSFESIASSAQGRPRHWLSSLVWKEIQLHQANLLIAVLLLALNIISVSVLKIHPRFTNPNVTYMLEAVGILWLLMPLVIGGTAVSEERRMGILDSHLCLPASRRAQLLVKFSVALLLSLFLGGAMPMFMDHADNLDIGIFAVAAAIFYVSFYASSFARSTVQAIGLAIVICMMMSGLLSLQSMRFGSFAQAPGGLMLLTVCLGSVTLLLVFGVLIFWNFSWVHENKKVWRRNVISVLIAFTGILAFSDAIYFRAWELFVPIQPAAGAARLSSSAELKLSNTYNTLYFVKPDGRLWTATLGYDDFHYDKDYWMVVSHEKSRTESIGGTNWVDVAADDFQAVGVQADGTLWSIQRKWNGQSRWRQDGPFSLAKIGQDADWSQAAGDWNGFLLLKKDGSLWTWGTHESEWNHLWRTRNKLRLDRSEFPVRISGNETFTEVLSSRGQAYARKDDGTVWHWTGWNDTNYLCTLTHETKLDNQWSDFVAQFTERSYQSENSILGVTTNGALFLNEDFRWHVADGAEFKSRHVVLPLGQNAKWRIAAYGPYTDIWAIREDGTLWQWAPRWDLERLRKAKPVQLGSRSDWVALGGNLMAGLALAADGSLWAWDQPSRHIWLAPSRRPIYVGNIFEGTDNAAARPTQQEP